MTSFKVLRNFQDKVEGQLAFGLRKNSEFKALFDYHLIKLEQVRVHP